MDILNNYKMPNPQPTTLSDILKFITEFTPFAGVFALLWKCIDKVAKYYSDRADERLRQIVKDEVKPDMAKLSHAIDELREAIWELKK